MNKVSFLFAASLMMLASNLAYSQTALIQHKSYLIPVTPNYQKCIDQNGELEKPKVIISTDLGLFSSGADPDDIQSMVHMFATSNRFDLLGIISSRSGGKNDVKNLVDAYAQDYANNTSLSADGYPAPSTIVLKQGVDFSQSVSTDPNDQTGFNNQGVGFIVEQAQKVLNGENCGPVYLLVWGPIQNLAIALKKSEANNLGIHNALRVYSIASSNRISNQSSYDYITNKFLKSDRLWFIQSEDTFRGMGNNNDENGPALNDMTESASSTAQSCLAYALRRASDKTINDEDRQIKAGDTPSLLHLLDPSWSLDVGFPSSVNWGGKYKLKDERKQHWVDDVGQTSIKDNAPSFLADWTTSMANFNASHTSSCRNTLKPTIP